VLILLIVVGTAVYALVKYLSIERIDDLGVDTAARDEPRNYLVVGSDERDLAEESGVEGQRSDTLMVVRVDPAAGQASTLSIPRDLVVPIAGTGESDRINSAYAVDRATVVDTVRDALDIEVHHYVEVDFTSFESLVDALGGVDIWVEQAIKDEASGLFVEDLGCVSLDGETALAFVRSRHLQYMTEVGTWSDPDPSADLGRVDRQQVFVRQAVAEALAQVKANPARLPEMVDVATGAVAIDDKMSVRDLVAIAQAMSDVDPSDHRSLSLPVVERGDGATLGLAEDEVDDVLDHFRGDGAEETSGSASGGTGGRESGSDTASSSSEFQLGEPPPGESC
jgi:LCP family protein required for cell wall assembly